MPNVTSFHSSNLSRGSGTEEIARTAELRDPNSPVEVFVCEVSFHHLLLCMCKGCWAHAHCVIMSSYPSACKFLRCSVNKFNVLTHLVYDKEFA